MSTESEMPEKITKGEAKMIRYIEDLARNSIFKKRINRLNKLTKTQSHNRETRKEAEGAAFTLSEEESAEIDRFNFEIREILDGYAKIKSRYKKLLHDREFRAKRRIAEDYNIDHWGIFYAVYCLQKNDKAYELLRPMFELDMCKICDLEDEENNPTYSKDDLIHLNPSRMLRRIAYPVSILINPRASKRDVLDFIEKKWPFIESNLLRSYSDKKLKFGKRKHDQEILDYIWDNRRLPPMSIKEMLDVNFPKNDLVYYEISKIIKQEKDKRLGSLM